MDFHDIVALSRYLATIMVASWPEMLLPTHSVAESEELLGALKLLLQVRVDGH